MAEKKLPLPPKGLVITAVCILVAGGGFFMMSGGDTAPAPVVGQTAPKPPTNSDYPFSLYPQYPFGVVVGEMESSTIYLYDAGNKEATCSINIGSQAYNQYMSDHDMNDGIANNVVKIVESGLVERMCSRTDLGPVYRNQPHQSTNSETNIVAGDQNLAPTEQTYTQQNSNSQSGEFTFYPSSVGYEADIAYQYGEVVGSGGERLSCKIALNNDDYSKIQEGTWNGGGVITNSNPCD